jgi:hypothetical protein
MFFDRDQGTVDSTGTTRTNGLTRRAFLERAAVLGKWCAPLGIERLRGYGEHSNNEWTDHFDFLGLLHP